jgi:lysophospholipase L1-like esterase
LYSTGNLRRFFESLATLDEGKAAEDVRVVQYGDSHTAADFETGTVRRLLQGRFGDGGRGFVVVGKPWKTYLQDGLKQPGMTREWNAELVHVEKDKSKPAGDGCYGLGGVCLLTAKKARAWAEVTAVASRVEVAYWEQPRGGGFELVVDGVRAAKIATAGDKTTSAFKSFDVAEGPHTIEVKTAGDGDVRLFGVTLDRTQNGLVYDALGINGARVTTALAWSEPHMAEQLAHRKPDLVVLAYGTNESFDDTPIATYERQLVDLLGRLARAVPTASCLLMGPPDRAVETKDGWMSSPRVRELADAQRRVAEAAGCAFFDQLEAMGGPGTAITWFDEPEPRMAKDHVHLTRGGYTQLGTSFANELLHSYVSWRADKGMPPVNATMPATAPSVRTPPRDDGEPVRPAPFVAIPM